MTVNSVETGEGALILDSHKLEYHFERVEAWDSGEKIAPISIDMALTRTCGAMCSFCYAMVQEPQERASIRVKEALELADDFAEEHFKDTFNSNRYSEIINYLSSPNFDAQTMMGTLPIQHYVSEALDNHKRGIKLLKRAEGAEPLRVNFL